MPQFADIQGSGGPNVLVSLNTQTQLITGNGDLTVTGNLAVSGTGTLSTGQTSFTAESSNVVTNAAATYTQLTSDNIIIQTTAGSTYTLLSAVTYPGRKIRIVTQFSGAVISASSNVVPLAGGSAGTAILAPTAGKWADLQSNGTNWVITASN